MKTKRKYTKRAVAPVPEAVEAVQVPVAVVPVPTAPKPSAGMRKPVALPPDPQPPMFVIDLAKFKLAASKGGFVPYDGDGYYSDGNFWDKDFNVFAIDAPVWAKKVVWILKEAGS